MTLDASQPDTALAASGKPLNIAVVGSGISGLSCAWLLSRQHQVTLFEKDDRPGGHSNTVDVRTDVGSIGVDTGFIVFNPRNYPNLVQLFEHLQVPVQATDMSFSVSLDNGGLEYSGSGLRGLFAQKRNLLNPRFLGMVRDILRFYRECSNIDPQTLQDMTLGQLLKAGGYGNAFRDHHLLPMGAAIWSTPMQTMLDYPASAFLRFCANHGLLQLEDRPQWHSVVGGSREYVRRLCDDMPATLLVHRAIRSVRRIGGKVLVADRQGGSWKFDHIVFACHADQALKLLEDPRAEETEVLRHFKFERNRAVLHSDTGLMPVRRQAWASWNYLGSSGCLHAGDHPQSAPPAPEPADIGTAAAEAKLSVSYWMNQLQKLPTRQPLIVTLNPFKEPAPGSVHASFLYDHPLFDLQTQLAQSRLWNIQGNHHTWFCGAWCGYGFHEDGLQSGLLVAEALGQCQRPWQVAGMNSRIPQPDGWQSPLTRSRVA